MKISLGRRAVAEFLGTAFLVAAVIGSGIMSDRLSGANVGLALLENTIATGAALIALILTFGPISGAHLNPVVTIMDALQHGLPWSETPFYILSQLLGGISGAVSAHLMFGLPLISLSTHGRSGAAQAFSEFVATFGLISVIGGSSRLKPTAVPFAVGAFITAAYWFTASTSFANPAVTLARCLSDTFAGIRPAMLPGSFWRKFWAVWQQHCCFVGWFQAFRQMLRTSSSPTTRIIDFAHHLTNHGREYEC